MNIVRTDEIGREGFLRPGDWYITDADPKPLYVVAVDVYPACTAHTHVTYKTSWSEKKTAIGCYDSGSMASRVKRPEGA